jgi:hypothetical protein
MLEKLRDIWDDYGFEIILGIAFLIIVFTALARIGKTGTWSSNYSYTPIGSIHRPPQESKGEIECRRVLEQIFNKSFHKARPSFLNNPVTGGLYSLELDCFNNDLRLGCEYSGQQHYKYIPFFHRNKEAFFNQKYKDELKRRLCVDNGVTLIEVPYTVKIEDIKDYLIQELTKTGYIK